MDHSRSAVDLFNKIASAYQDKFMDMDLYDDTYDRFCGLIEKRGAEIFEIGCGPGNITKYLLSKRPDFQITGIDLAPNMLELAKANCPAAEFMVMDAREIGKLAEKFDGIVCGFTLPYLSKEECAMLIRDSAALLNEDGILYFSAIEGDYEGSTYETNSKGDRLFVYFHEEKFLLEQLEKHRFVVEAVLRKEYPRTESEKAIHLIVIARKA